MSWGELLLAVGSVVLALQSGYTAALMLYAWEDEDKHVRSRVPTRFELLRQRFTVLLPARH